MLNYKFYQAKCDTDELLVMLHGFISDQQAFSKHVCVLQEKLNILTVDLPGHGQDGSDTNQTWDFPFITNQLDELLKSFQSYQLFLHGYSMGGRIALYYVIEGEITLSGLILESTSPGIEELEDRNERQLVDQARAKVLEIAGLEIFVNDWEKLPLFYTQHELDKSIKKEIRDMRLRQNPLRLAKALRDYGTGQMPNLWPKLKQIKVPTCIIVGVLDGKFCKIAKQMETMIHNTELNEIERSGHTVHVEEFAEFDRIVLGFIHKEEQND
ncbi:2-succinyl-6-hydroxy-2,4-cyclohexadiene-1-carboxylate synthase [Staphylococcus pseudoxylosus]|uniref:2-succinyl-6-hydroxy-2, 4-cyclohexadiene-1-carboxylate synthase n=1 Tax=Staphylococcus pseudoxylosus TaxID=2282419 RepID=UPI002DBAA048|nr:2-succinyl-6-hydroxy-2,4-cyclohexadiene-1-carboxylate synthase [Staphylococcus pseudoxylosus]MEB6037584.1 2-succinyl-6-hydroxy-2,4-cyclohexadiene-1-carboxylate synthase [Staphylococcus pseudoxylosus]MEB6046062.1 2-succinyl-6-hydroxy-2,4-cyclohexadiene-1-carboxylate synthase [Staphylococcus pseudoxylosus]MEB7753074.1 2-succinyl-6-hydroxy-2,4-cyclohexadiene-1-carboxylate synthase [Staphylococcus pseudoxylosus]MEB7763865.1 2-succinyl-6-hydroxy-2,4-cyclohexadiene-1-carboxylate synthase [Staphylo